MKATHQPLNTSHYKIEFGFGVGKDRNQKDLNAAVVACAMEAIRTEAARRFGAYTLTLTQGGWTNPNFVLVTEPGFTLSILREGSAERDSWRDEDFAQFIGNLLDQEAVAVTVTPVFFHIAKVVEP